MNDKQDKGTSVSMPLADMKQLVWNEYLENLKSLRAEFPDDFKDTPLEPTMPDDINEIFKLRNSLYRYMDDPLWVDIHSSK